MVSVHYLDSGYHIVLSAGNVRYAFLCLHTIAFLCLHTIAASAGWMDTYSEKAEQTRGTEEFEIFGSSFVLKRASTLLEGLVQILLLPLTTQLGKWGIVVHIHQSVSQNGVLGLLAQESSGMLVIINTGSWASNLLKPSLR